MQFDCGEKIVYEAKLIITALITTKVDQADEVSQKVEAILLSVANEAKRKIEEGDRDLTVNASKIRPLNVEFAYTEGDTPLIRLQREETRIQNELTHIMAEIYVMKNNQKASQETLHD
jgi:hypothetical protein